MAAASLVEHRLQARELQPLQRAGAGAVAQGLVALRHAGLPRSGIEAMPPALASGSLTAGPPGTPLENTLLWGAAWLSSSALALSH